MMNPDGVVRGHYRLDSNGFDLNRMYRCAESNRELFPSIAALMTLARYLDSEKRLHAYFDLHATVYNHSSFCYANTHTDLQRNVKIHSFPLLMELVCESFKYGDPSTFHIK